MNEPLIEVCNLSLDIPIEGGVIRPLRNIDFSVAKGETVAIVGESGCGKSLTALAVMGLLPRNARLTADRISLSGQSLLALNSRQWSEIRGVRMAMIFQDPMTAFDPCYRIGDQIAEILRLHRPVCATTAHIVATLTKVGVSSPVERLRQYPHQLSGGLRQRLMIATALLCEPELIIADEPTTALDVTIQAQILRLLADMQRETGIGLLLISHDLGVVAGIADRVVVMYSGEVVEMGKTDSVIGSPQHPYTQGLIRSIPRLGGQARRETLGHIPGTVPRPVQTRTECGFFARCPHAQAACRVHPVPLVTRNGSIVRCVSPVEKQCETETLNYAVAA